MAKLYKGLASQCAGGQDGSCPEAVRDGGLHPEDLLQPLAAASGAVT